MIGVPVSIRGTSRPVSDSGFLNVITIANKQLCKTRARSCPLKIEGAVLHRVGI